MKRYTANSVWVEMVSTHSLIKVTSLIYTENIGLKVNVTAFMSPKPINGTINLETTPS